MLALTGAKGGVGRSTTVLGLAMVLADRGRRPVVVDADRDTPDLHAIAGTPCRPGVRGLARGRSVDEVATRVAGVRVITARPGTTTGDRRAALARLSSRSEPVLVDCPAGVGRDVGLALAAADDAAVVTTPRPTAVRGAATATRLARSLDTHVLGAVVTKTAAAVGLEPVLDTPVLASIPPADDPVTDTVCKGEYVRVTTEYIYQNS